MTADETSTVRYYDELGCWVAWGREAAQSALQDSRLSSETLEAANLSYLPADMHEECSHLIETMRRWFVLLDGDRHTVARRAIQPMFSPRRIRKLEETIEVIVAEELDAFAASGATGDFDVITGLADKISARTIALLLGLPGDDDATLHRWAKALADFLASSYRRDCAVNAQAALQEMGEFIKNAPDEEGESIWSRATGGEWDRLATSSMVLFGGLETTAGLIGFAVWYMLGNDLAEQVAASEAGEEAKAVVERVLDVYAPLGHVARMASEDTELGGCPIAEGDLVLVSLTGRDLFDAQDLPTEPSGHQDGDRFDHVAFGYGMHYCVGAPLARVTVANLLTQFARRFPKASVKDVAWRKNRTFRGFDHLVLDVSGPQT
ncbi:cytochrome P450 [Streptomyces sp. ISL-1]|uniref:cytochrome P450 n=1 Tax=Streptomyces sp. ISL-1 TaxID=2817657 RepID=UPI001BE6DE0D|nr:cytochrome P450 [Streptomyces sp. ISL-1]MBT2393902.1 cytochrome P450 [Streptomyces sp. ISL-1]